MKSIRKWFVPVVVVASLLFNPFSSLIVQNANGEASTPSRSSINFDETLEDITIVSPGETPDPGPDGTTSMNNRACIGWRCTNLAPVLERAANHGYGATSDVSQGSGPSTVAGSNTSAKPSGGGPDEQGLGGHRTASENDDSNDSDDSANGLANESGPKIESNVISEWREIMGYKPGSPGGTVAGYLDKAFEDASRIIPLSKQVPLLEKQLNEFINKNLVQLDAPGEDLIARSIAEVEKGSAEIPYVAPQSSQEISKQVGEAFDKVFWDIRPENPADVPGVKQAYTDRALEGIERVRLPRYERYAQQVETKLAEVGRTLKESLDSSSAARASILQEVGYGSRLSEILSPPGIGSHGNSPESAAGRNTGLLVNDLLGAQSNYLTGDHPFYSPGSRDLPPDWQSPSGPYRQSLEEVHKRLEAAKPAHIQGIEARAIGIQAVRLADHKFANGDAVSSQAFRSIAFAMADLAVGLSPLGTAKDVYESITGKSLLDGHKLAGYERGLAVFGAVVGIVTGGVGAAPAKAALKGLVAMSKLAHQTKIGATAMKAATRLAWSGLKIGLKTKEELEELIKTVARPLGNEVGAIGDLEKAADSTGKALKLGAKTPTGIKIYSRVETALATLPEKFNIRFIREGTDANKIAIIGRSMGSQEKGALGVRDVANALESRAGVKPRIFDPSEGAWLEFMAEVKKYREVIGNPTANLPEQLVRESKAFKENAKWVEDGIKEGYTFIDAGNPNGLSALSIFYEMEKALLIGKAK
jgi:hypothetical protein